MVAKTGDIHGSSELLSSEELFQVTGRNTCLVNKNKRDRKSSAYFPPANFTSGNYYGVSHRSG